MWINLSPGYLSTPFLAVSIFGSVVRGDDGPGSDLDLLVEFDECETWSRTIAIRPTTTWCGPR
jgi:predicted nucleotidyltransferase